MPIRYPNAHLLDAPETRMVLVLRIEWTLLALRYITYVVLAALSINIDEPQLLRALFVAGSSALAHNVFAHWALHTQRHQLFVSPINFLLYLARICLLTGVTGGETSPFAPLFLFLVIGYHLYTPRRPQTLWVVLLICSGYSFTVLAHWFAFGVNWMHPSLYVNLCYIAFCGWIMNSLAQVLGALEQNARRHAVALFSSESALRAILNHTAHPIVVYGDNELITEINDSACTFLGLPREKLIGARFQTFVFDDGSLQSVMDELRESGSLYQEMLMLPASGSERNVYMHVHSFLRKNQRFFVALFHDITEQKEFLETSRLAKEKLEEAHRELQRVVDLRAAFYANVGNRLRSPLSAMLGFTDMLLDEQLGEINGDQRGALHSCRRSIMRIFGLLEEAFAPSQDPGRQAEETAPSDMDKDNGGGI